MKKQITFKGEKCKECGDFYAQVIEFHIQPRMLQQDRVHYKLLCRECAEGE